MKKESRRSNSFRKLMTFLMARTCKLAVVSACLAGFMLTSPLAMAQDKALSGLGDGLYAKMETTRGVIVLELYYDKTPLTVMNFAGLAMGVKDSNAPKGQPFYNGLTFHRVIKDFMIQGGDPQGTGTGGPGYAFADEFHPALKHDSAGILSMANSGPATNGSQFFITHKATPWLDFKHTVFGKVVRGQDVVDLIAQGDKINQVTIVAVGEKAKAFQYDQAAFDALIHQAHEKAAAARKADMAAFKEKMTQKYPDAVAAEQGLMYVQIKEGKGMPARKGRKVDIHFTGRLENGKVFADSKAQGTPFSFVLGAGEVLKGWDIGVLGMKKGEVRRLLLPYALAYGEKGYPGVIPPKADLIFDVELVNLN